MFNDFLLLPAFSSIHPKVNLFKILRIGFLSFSHHFLPWQIKCFANNSLNLDATTLRVNNDQTVLSIACSMFQINKPLRSNHLIKLKLDIPSLSIRADGALESRRKIREKWSIWKCKKQTKNQSPRVALLNKYLETIGDRRDELVLFALMSIFSSLETQSYFSIVDFDFEFPILELRDAFSIFAERLQQKRQSVDA